MKRVIAEHIKVIAEHATDFISEKEIVRKLAVSLKEKKPLKLKIGFDPTVKDIHLGHVVLLRKLRKIQDLGHIVYMIIGDFTAQIGDPSGKSELRPVLSRKEIEANATTYTDQAFKILHRKNTKILFNSQWYKNMSASDFIKLLSRYTVARMIERDDFSKRMKENKPLTMQEFVYPLVQGYDSVKIKADIEFGGTDQKFNLIVGRHLQESFGQVPQGIITMPLLLGLDGKNKMSKSLGNYIGITEDPNSMFGKIMSISDKLMWEYTKFLTDLDIDSMKAMHPKEAKLKLARHIVMFYHSEEAAEREKQQFKKVFSERKIPENIPVYTSDTDVADLAEVLYKSGLVVSKNEARRLIDQNSLSCDGLSVNTPSVKIPSSGIILKVGKRRFIKITYSRRPI